MKLGRKSGWRLAGFLVLFVTLQALYGAARGTWVERLVIDRLTVGTAARVIDAFDPALGVHAERSRLKAPGGGLNILNGCEGIEVVFLLVSALLVAPIAWRARAAGVAAGALLIFVFNQGRIIALFYAYRLDRGMFDLLHGLITPLVMVVAALAFFMLWLNRHADPRD